MTEVSRSKTFTPSSIRGAFLITTGISRRGEADFVGSTAAISCIDSPGVSRVMIMPGAGGHGPRRRGRQGEIAVVRRPEQSRDERQQGEEADRGDLRPRDVRPHDVHPAMTVSGRGWCRLAKSSPGDPFAGGDASQTPPACMRAVRVSAGWGRMPFRPRAAHRVPARNRHDRTGATVISRV